MPVREIYFYEKRGILCPGGGLPHLYPGGGGEIPLECLWMPLEMDVKGFVYPGSVGGE